MATRRRQVERTLDPETLRVLAGGWGAPPPESDPDPFYVFTLSRRELVELGHAHRAEVEAEARALGRNRPWFLELAERIGYNVQ